MGTMRRDGPDRALRSALAGFSLLGWGMLVLAHRGLFLPGLCGPPGGAIVGWDWGRVELLFLLNPPETMALSWLLMLTAMMAPLLATPLARLCHDLAPTAAAASGVAFAAGYLLLWMAAGGLLSAVAIALHATAGAFAPAIALGLALGWHGTPIRRACVAECRCRSASMNAVRWQALSRGFIFGIRCLGACWALMLMAMMAGPAHLAAMALVSLVAFAERRTSD